MSLGNVSSTRVNGHHFHEALAYLRRASEIPDYELPTHLQQYVFTELRSPILTCVGILMSTARWT